MNGKLVLSQSYYGHYRLANEAKQHTVILHTPDKQVAVARLRKLVAEAEREAAGIGVPKHLLAAAQKPLLTHMEDFLTDLDASGRDKMYCANLRCRLKALIEECGWQHPKNVTADSFMAWRSQQKFAPKTLNDYLDAANGLLKWMLRTARLEINPLQLVRKVKTAGRETRVRRALSVKQVQRLLEVSGERKIVYLTAINSGLRRAELAALQKGDCFLDDKRPHLKVRASTTKNAKSATIWLNEEVTAELKKLIPAGAGASEKVFAKIPDMDQFRKDLAAAEIPFLDEYNRRMDFHALRTTLGTNLALSGVAPRMAMEFMRHSELKLTQKNYTDVTCLPLAEAADVLPKFLGDKWTQKGTQGLVASGLKLSPGVANQIRAGEQKSIDNKGESLIPSLAVAECRKTEMVHPSGVEPETC